LALGVIRRRVVNAIVRLGLGLEEGERLGLGLGLEVGAHYGPRGTSPTQERQEPLRLLCWARILPAQRKVVPQGREPTHIMFVAGGKGHELHAGDLVLWQLSKTALHRGQGYIISRDEGITLK
jgi:hypothetical protein